MTKNASCSELGDENASCSEHRGSQMAGDDSSLYAASPPVRASPAMNKTTLPPKTSTQFS